MAYQDVNRAGKWTPPKSKASGPKTGSSKEAWTKANAGRANASNSPPKPAAKSAAPAKTSPRMGGAKSPVKTVLSGRQSTPAQVAPKSSVTGRKPSSMVATAPKSMAGTVKTTGASGATMAALGGAKDKGDNTRLPSGVDRPADPTPTPTKTKAPASASKTASTPQPKNSPPVPVSKPAGMGGSNGDALGGSSAVSKTPNYAVKAIQARSGPGRAPSGPAASAPATSAGFTKSDMTGGMGGKTRMANYSYMDREK